MAGKTNQINKDILGQLREFRQEVNRAGINVEAMIMFGSMAKGNPKPWSDIDVAVISPDFGRDYHNELVRLLQLSDRVSTAIEPHPLTPDDLNDRWSSLAAEIREHGILID